MSQGYNVYKVQYRLGIPDALTPGTRYHTVVFVETDADRGGYIYHVTGDLATATGMIYQCKKGPKPEDSLKFYRKTYLGQIRVSDFQEIGRLLQSIPPPPRQRIFLPTTMRYEQCKPDGTLYGPHEERPPYFKCTEWTEQRAIPTLERAGIIHRNGVASSTQAPSTQASGSQASGSQTSGSQASSSQTGATSSSAWIWDEQYRRHRYFDGEKWVWQ